MKITHVLSCLLLVSLPVCAEVLPSPSDDLLYNLKQSMVKIGTTTKSGGHGFGTGIAISKELVVTNCHVVDNANGISISKWGTEYPAESLQADWKHDLCILKVQYADLKPVVMGDSAQLSYEQPVISISMPYDSPAPYVALSTIKAIYPLDNAQVIRTQAAFSIGASGSPVFDYEGKLIAISTFKSPGRHAYFYNMPVNLVKAVMHTEAVSLNTQHEAPFWDMSDLRRPFFMQIVLPFQNHRWLDVKEVASRWTNNEPNNAEAWYYMGEAAVHLDGIEKAKIYYQKALALQPNHPASLLASVQIATREGQPEQAEEFRLKIKEINPELLDDLNEITQ